MFFFPEIGRAGRLGNQLFQVAATKALALRNKSEAYLPDDIDTRVTHGQSSLLKYFKHNLPLINSNECRDLPKFYENFNDFCYVDSRIFDISGSTALVGQFESESYFIDFKEEIKKTFQCLDSIENFSIEYLNALKKEKQCDKVVGIHFRLGDADPVRNSIGWYVDYILEIKNKFFSDEDYHFLFFTGGTRQDGNDNSEDISYLRNFFSGGSISFCEVNDTIKEFCIMKHCDHLILNWRSTLSWWAGYLNTNINKKIVVPKQIPNIIYNSECLWSKDFIVYDKPI
jgi:hypothetical protein